MKIYWIRFILHNNQLGTRQRRIYKSTIQHGIYSFIEQNIKFKTIKSEYGRKIKKEIDFSNTETL